MLPPKMSILNHIGIFADGWVLNCCCFRKFFLSQYWTKWSSTPFALKIWKITFVANSTDCCFRTKFVLTGNKVDSCLINLNCADDSRFVWLSILYKFDSMRFWKLLDFSTRKRIRSRDLQLFSGNASAHSAFDFNADDNGWNPLDTFHFVIFNLFFYKMCLKLCFE